MGRILVTGATGHIGSQVVEQLVSAGRQTRALSRDPKSAALPQAVEVVAGDLAAPDTLDPALEDVDAVFLVWVLPLAAAGPAIEKIASRAKRLVVLTSPHRTEHPFFQQPNALRGVHAKIEELVQESGLLWTFLRPGAFALNCVNWWAPQTKAGNTVRWFHADAATAPIDERDIAAVAVRALCGAGHAGKEYVLTGRESLTQREQVETIGNVIGRPLRFEELSPDSARRELLNMWPPAVADMLLSAYGAAVGLPAYVTSTVEEIAGRPAFSFRQWAENHATSFHA